MGENQPEKPFNHKQWAGLVGLIGLSQLSVPYILRDFPNYTTANMVVNIASGILALVAAVGIWMKRRWGLGLYALVVVVAVISIIYQMGVENSATGEITNAFQRLVGIAFGILFLGVLYSRRHHFE